MAIFGLDLHPQFQAGFNFKRAKELGYKFVFIKFAEGPYPSDGSVLPLPGLKEFYKRAKDSGMIVGYYDYLIETSAQRQADHFLDRIDKMGGGIKGHLIATDFEGYGQPNSTWYYLSPSNSTLKAFNQLIQREIKPHGVKLGLYTGPGYWNEGTPSGDFNKYNADYLWHAQYPHMINVDQPQKYYREQLRSWSEGLAPVGGEKWKMHQFLATGLVAGQYVDVNVFRGTEAELKALAGLV